MTLKACRISSAPNAPSYLTKPGRIARSASTWTSTPPARAGGRRAVCAFGVFHVMPEGGLKPLGDSSAHDRVSGRQGVRSGFKSTADVGCSPAKQLVGIPPVVAHELEALVGNVLGDRGDKVARGQDLEVAPDLLVYAAAVEDRFGCRSRAWFGCPHLFDRKGVADDVLGGPFNVCYRPSGPGCCELPRSGASRSRRCGRPTRCPKCLREMRIVSLIDQEDVLEGILRHLGLCKRGCACIAAPTRRAKRPSIRDSTTPSPTTTPNRSWRSPPPPGSARVRLSHPLFRGHQPSGGSFFGLWARPATRKAPV